MTEFRCSDCGHSFGLHRSGRRGWWGFVYCIGTGCEGCAYPAHLKRAGAPA